ncbi:MAG: polysaccharide biosynthesis protein, partial [Clostridia bacterium]|nr:polysaccharide biosynthesis protein [Clostridia bacterium]
LINPEKLKLEELISVRAYNVYSMMPFTTSAVISITHIVYALFSNGFTKKVKLKDKKRTLIVGAGSTGSTVVEELSRRNSIYEPICFVDDDMEKRGRIINGVPIVGSTQEIPRLAAKYSISIIIFAIPSLPSNARKNIIESCMKTGCQVKVLPFVSELIGSADTVSQIREVNIGDLLGRQQITFGLQDVSAYVKGKVCMITGGGGSIGSELVRQIAKYSPSKIVIVDIYENTAYEIQQEILRNYGADFPICVEIASVTDRDKLDELFAEHNPRIVFHAAAHKHVPLMETNPEEACKNNIFGTLNTVQMADKHGVEKFVMISTDKAVNPTNVMGATKRCCEKIVQMMAQEGSRTEFAAVRFGNVLGSNGS